MSVVRNNETVTDAFEESTILGIKAKYALNSINSAQDQLTGFANWASHWEHERNEPHFKHVLNQVFFPMRNLLARKLRYGVNDGSADEIKDLMVEFKAAIKKVQTEKASLRGTILTEKKKGKKIGISDEWKKRIEKISKKK